MTRRVTAGLRGRHKPSEVVRCIACGEPREVTYETAQRIRTGVLSGVCMECRWHPLEHLDDAEVLVEDEHLAFWLKWAGVRLPRGMSAREWVGVFGVPHTIAELAAEADGAFSTMLRRAA